MTTYSTQNPVGSAAAKDLYDNAENLDVLVNDLDKLKHPDRLGVERITWHGMEERFKESLINVGFVNMGDYAPDIVITEYNQTVRDSDGNFWRISGQVNLPYTTTGAGLPEDDAFIFAGDINLRSDLSGAPSSGLGAMLVNGAITYLDNVATLIATAPKSLGQVVYVSEYHAGTGYGGGFYEAVAASYGGPDFEESASDMKWKLVTENNSFSIDRLGAKKGDAALTRLSIIKAIDCAIFYGGGIISFPSGKWETTKIEKAVNCSDITFLFNTGSHLELLGSVMLGWYPDIPDLIPYKNISFIGNGVIESGFGAQWGNDFVHCENITLKEVNFIRPILSGHFLDLMSCRNVKVDGIRVMGGGMTRRAAGTARLFSEFVQVSLFTKGGLQWPQDKYPSGYSSNIPSSNVLMTNCTFEPYTDEIGTTFPPRPIGNHGAGTVAFNCFNITVLGNVFDNIQAQVDAGRSIVELPNCTSINFNDNLIKTDNAVNGASGTTSTSHLTIDCKILGANPSYKVTGNTFVSSWNRYFTAVRNTSYGDFIFSNNAVKSSENFADIVSIEPDTVVGTTPISVTVDGNSIESNGRRFVGSSTRPGANVTISSNIIKAVGTGPDEARPAISLPDTGVHVVSNNQCTGWRGFVNATVGLESNRSTVSITGNALYLMPVGTPLISIKEGILTGNIIKSSGASPIVKIDGTAVSSLGYNYVVLV